MSKKMKLWIVLFVATVSVIDAHKRNGNGNVEEKEVVGSSFAIEDIRFDSEKKRDEVIALVKRAKGYLQKNNVDSACSMFTHEKAFIVGDLYVFMYDIQGTILAHGTSPDLVWQNGSELRDSLGVPFVKNMLQKAQQGGGWVTYEWRGATKLSYVELVSKDGKDYVVGAGYYPHSKRDAVVGLVQAAVDYFYTVLAKGISTQEIFSSFSYPLGRFVVGDLYLFSLDFDGIIMAQGDRPGLIGQSAWDYRDENGLYMNREIVKRLQETQEGVWIEYRSKGARKMTYAQKVKGLDDKPYFIACGYYPDSDREAVVNLVKKGYEYIKGQGKSQAKERFTDEQDNEFRNGDLYLALYDMKGLCQAHGGNREYVGKNFFEEKDEDGRFYMQEFIAKAKSGGGWVDYKIKNSFITVYVEKVTLGVGDFIITSGLFPISKRETMILLVKSGASYLKTNGLLLGLREFTNPSSKFARGDLSLFVIDSQGICFAWGSNYDLIWKNIYSWTDDTGKPFVQIFSKTVMRGAGAVEYQLNKVKKLAYVEPVELDGKQYIVGSVFDN